MSSKKSLLTFTFDVDGVLANTAPLAVKLFNKKYKQSKKVRDLTDFFIIGKWLTEILGDEKTANQEAISIWNDKDVQLNSKPVNGAVELVRMLLHEGNNLHFITSRPGHTKGVTLKWFKKWLPEIKLTNIHMNSDESVSGMQFKVNKVKQLYPNIHFDDSVEHINEISKNSPELDIILVRQPWNLFLSQINNNKIWVQKGKKYCTDLKISYEYYLKMKKK